MLMVDETSLYAARMTFFSVPSYHSSARRRVRYSGGDDFRAARMTCRAGDAILYSDARWLLAIDGE